MASSHTAFWSRLVVGYATLSLGLACGADADSTDAPTPAGAGQAPGGAGQGGKAGAGAAGATQGGAAGKAAAGAAGQAGAPAAGQGGKAGAATAGAAGSPAGQGGAAGSGQSGGAGKAGAPGSEAACDAGGQDAESKGAEAPFGEAVVGLCRRALGCPATWQLAPPPEGYMNKGTPNHKLLWRVWYYGWSQEAAPQKVPETRAFLLDFFNAQLAAGHQALGNAASGGSGNEVLTSSHYQIWANGMTCARLLAVVHDDQDLLQATGRWWRGERALYDVLQRGGSIDAPGARFKEGQTGPNELRNTIHAMLQKKPLPGGAAKPKGPWWSNYYNVSAWTLRELLRLGDDLGGPAGEADIPPLRDPLLLYTKGEDYVFVFPKMRGALEPLFWVAPHRRPKTTYAPYAAGNPVDNTYPPPELPGAALTTLPGVP